MPACSLVIYLYNEVETIPALATDLVDIMGMLSDALPASADGIAVEVFFVDDGSTDRPAEALAAAQSRLPSCRVLRHTENRGVGAALKTGFAAAAGSLIVTIPGDHTFLRPDGPLQIEFWNTVGIRCHAVAGRDAMRAEKS